LNRLSGPVSGGRPDKRDRRDLLRFLQDRGRSDDDDDPADNSTGDRPAGNDADADGDE
jgi:hypothetical protein